MTPAEFAARAPNLFDDIQHILRNQAAILQALAEVQGEQVLAGQLARQQDAQIAAFATEVHTILVGISADAHAILDAITPQPPEVVGIDVKPGPVTTHRK